jgi:hypothetical protein
MFATFFRQLAQILTWFIVVAPWEQAIRVRLGKHKRLLEPGFYVRIPFIDRVFRQSVRRRLHVMTPQTLTSRDRQIVTCGGAVGYAISDLFKLYDTLESPNDTIANEVAGLVSRFISSKSLAECSAAELEKYVMEHLDLSRYGLSGQEFILTSFASTKAYRLIMGEIPGWSRDGLLNMAESVANAPA